MIKINSDGAAKSLTLLESVVRSGRNPTSKEIEDVLSTESMDLMIRAYSRVPEFSKEGFIEILSNLTKPNLVGKGLILSKMEKGLRSCLNSEKIVQLHRRLKKIEKLDLSNAERTALKYLPRKTPIKGTVYLTIDAFNTGMMYEGNFFLSILRFDPNKYDISWFSHELHHAGFEYWIKLNPKLGTFLKEDRTCEGIAAKLILNLLLEGLANYFCTPENIHPPENAPKKNKKKIMKYEKHLNEMMQEVQSLLFDCLSKTMSVESCEKRLMGLLLDPNGILPPIHFIGGRIIEIFDKHPRIKRSEIVNLCKNPAHFFTLFSQIAEKQRVPTFPNDLVKKISPLLT